MSLNCDSGFLKCKQDSWSFVRPLSCSVLHPIPPLCFPGAQTHPWKMSLLCPAAITFVALSLHLLVRPRSVSSTGVSCCCPLRGSWQRNCRGGRRSEQFGMKFKSCVELPEQQVSGRIEQRQLGKKSC